jgi:hypothetical protein
VLDDDLSHYLIAKLLQLIFCAYKQPLLLLKQQTTMFGTNCFLTSKVRSRLILQFFITMQRKKFLILLVYLLLQSSLLTFL